MDVEVLLGLKRFKRGGCEGIVGIEELREVDVEVLLGLKRFKRGGCEGIVGIEEV